MQSIEKKVTLIYSKCLSDQTGASTVMRLLNGSIPLFAEKKVTMQVFSRERMLEGHQRSKEGILKGNGFKKWIVDILTILSRNHPLAAYALSYIQSMRPAKKMAIYMKNKVRPGDILFFHELEMAYYYLRLYGKQNPVVVVFHTDGEDFKMQKVRYKNFYGSLFYKRLMSNLRFVLKKVDNVGFVALSSANRFLELHPEYPKDKVFCSYNGLPQMKYIPYKNSFSIEVVCVGTVMERKGQNFIVEALGKLKAEGHNLTDLHFTIVGGGPLKTALEQKAIEYGITNQISFIGPSNEVDDYLKEADIFILPSTSEGLPMAILEAMRMALPIVATSVGGIPEMIIDKKTGLIIEPTMEGVYDFIRNINNYDWKVMGQESYRYFKEKFSIEAMVDSYVQVFRKIR